MKISILVPSHDMMPAWTAYDLAQLYGQTIANMEADVQIGILMVTGTYIHVARQELLRAALADGADYVLWVDADMRFPADALLRLLHRDRPIVGINYPRRELPARFTAAGMDGNLLVTDQDDTGVVEVMSLGFGLVLMDCNRLREILPKGETWFNFVHEPGNRKGEDTYFCDLVRGAGESIYVDQALSNECGHVGQYTFTTVHGRISEEVVAEYQDA